MNSSTRLSRRAAVPEAVQAVRKAVIQAKLDLSEREEAEISSTRTWNEGQLGRELERCTGAY